MTEGIVRRSALDAITKPYRHPAFQKDHNGGMLTPEMVDRLVDSCDKYLYLPQIAAANGISSKTLVWWLRKGRQHGCAEIYKNLADRFFEADARFQATCKNVAEAACRMYPRLIFDIIDKRWGKQRTIEELTSDEGELDTKAILENPPPDLLLALQDSNVIIHLLTSQALENHQVACLLENLGWKRQEDTEIP